MKASRPTRSLTPGRLRWLLGLFFLCIAIPTALLIAEAFSQLRWEAFHQQRQLAEALASRIDRTAGTHVEREESRNFADYQFLVVTGDPAQPLLQRSPLSAFPVNRDVPGLVGYFQVDNNGQFSTPLIPSSEFGSANTGLTNSQFARRGALAQHIRGVLSSNQLVSTGPGDLAVPAAAGSAEIASEVATLESTLQGAKQAFSRQLSEGSRGVMSHFAPASEPESQPLSRAPAGNEVPEKAAPAPLAKAPAVVGQAAFDALEETALEDAEQDMTPAGGVAQALSTAAIPDDAATSASKVVQERKQSKKESLGRLTELELDTRYSAAKTDKKAKAKKSNVTSKRKRRDTRKEQVAVAQAAPAPAETREREAGKDTIRITTFHTVRSRPVLEKVKRQRTNVCNVYGAI